jgi:hypothetical protein
LLVSKPSITSAVKCFKEFLSANSDTKSIIAKKGTTILFRGFIIAAFGPVPVVLSRIVELCFEFVRVSHQQETKNSKIPLICLSHSRTGLRDSENSGQAREVILRPSTSYIIIPVTYLVLLHLMMPKHRRTSN